MTKGRTKIGMLSCLAVLALCLSGLAALSTQANPQKKEPEKPKAAPARELAPKYTKWLDEEVVYIISDNEREAFNNLQTDEQREGFVKMFWKRRDPTPETPINEFREEHLRRIAFANRNYFEGKAGWRTDRGRVYIMFGPPDFFETNPGGGRGFLLGVNAPSAEFPAEVWTYRQIAGLKERIGRVDFTFVNYYAAGSYQLTSNPGLANALRNISLPARYAGYNDIPTEGQVPSAASAAQKASQLYGQSAMEQLQILAELTKSRGEVLEELERSERLRKLKGIVQSKASLTGLNFYSRENYLAGNDGLTCVPLSLEVAAKDLSFKPAKDRYQGLVNFYIEVKNEKGTAYQASDRLEMNLKEESYLRRFAGLYQYKQSMNLRPGKYLLHVVVWDEFSGNVGYSDKWIEVPAFSAKDFGLSDIILARGIQRMEAKQPDIVMDSKDIPALKVLEKTNLKVPDKVNMTNQAAGPFVFGNMEVNPNTLAEYTPDSDLMFFYQIYNPTFDDVLGMAKVRIENQIWKGNELLAAVNQPQETQISMAQKAAGPLNGSGKYSLANLAPGTYTLHAQVRDLFSGKTVEKKVNFKVKKATSGIY